MEDRGLACSLVPRARNPSSRLTHVTILVSSRGHSRNVVAYQRVEAQPYAKAKDTHRWTREKEIYVEGALNDRVGCRVKGRIDCVV